MVEDANLRRTDPKAYEARQAQREKQQAQREHEDRKKRLKFLDPSIAEAVKAPGATSPPLGVDLIDAYGNNLGGLMPVFPGGGYFSSPHYDTSTLPGMPTEVLSGRSSHGLPSFDRGLPHESNVEAASLVSTHIPSPGLSSFLPRTAYDPSHRTDVNKPEHDGQDRRTLSGGNLQPDKSSTSRKKSHTSTASVASSGQPNEGSLHLPQNVKKDAREVIRAAIISQLPLLGEQNLFFSPRGEETARATAAKLERNANNHAKDEADYRHRIESHVITINTDMKHLAEVLRLMEEKLATGKTASVRSVTPTGAGDTSHVGLSPRRSLRDGARIFSYLSLRGLLDREAARPSVD